MLTYNNDAQFKKDFVKQIVKHRKADQIVQGTYGKQNGQWHGCYLGCSLRSLDLLKGKPLKVRYSDHARMESEGIVPEWLSRLGERIFEGLPPEDAPLFVEQLSKAVPVGVTLDRVKWRFTVFILKENIERVLTLNISGALKTQVVDAVRGVLVVAENAVTTGKWDESAAAAEAAGEAAWAAWSAAWSAAESAWAAGESAAGSAARSAGEAAWSAGESAAVAWAAWAAAWAAAWSAGESAAVAWAAAYQRYAKELIRLLKKEGR